MNLKTRSIIFALAFTVSMISSMALAQRMPQDSWYLGHEFEINDYVGLGRFYHPHEAAVGLDNLLYVADRYNHRIQVFDLAGNPIRSWGGPGNLEGQLNEPTGIFVATNGLVYVCEAAGHRVQVFDASGKVVRVMGQYGVGEGQLNYPHGITVDNDGNIYVVEHNNARVSVFSAGGSFVTNWGGNGAADGQFQGAIAITRTPDNKIAVLERDGARRVQLFNTHGDFELKFTVGWSPHGIETDASGNFYITARNWAGIQVFTSTGSHVRTFGQNGGGSADNQFNPMGLAVHDGLFYICDWDNHRITVFNANGTWERKFGSHANVAYNEPQGIAVDGDGNIYISAHQANEILKFDSAYNFIKVFGSAGSGNGQFNGVLELAVGPDQLLYAVDHNGHRVQVFDLDGNFVRTIGSAGVGNGQFDNPWGIAVSSNRVYVADRDNHRVQVFDLDGNFLFKFGQQGSFDGYFQSPHGVAISPDGSVVVADSNNQRMQVLNESGSVLLKIGWPGWDWQPGYPYRVACLSDGVLVASGMRRYGGDRMRIYSNRGEMFKEWDSPWASLAETKSGDLIAAHGDRVVRVWKRTYRTVHPPQANALPLPMIVSQARRPGTGYVDIEYRVKDDDNVTVDTAMLAFKNGGNSLGDLILMRSFAEGTEANLGPNTAVGQIHKVTWDVQQDWNTDFGEVQFEVLAKDSRDLLNLDFIQIPAVGTNEALKISRTPLNDSDFLSLWYWWLANADVGLQFADGGIKPAGQSVISNGIHATYFENTDFTGRSYSRVDSEPYMPHENSTNTRGVPFQFYSIIWDGFIVAPTSGLFNFRIGIDDVVSIWFKNKRVINANNPSSFDFQLQQNEMIPVRIEYDDRGRGLHAFWLEWRPPGQNWRRVDTAQFKCDVTARTLAFDVFTTTNGRDYLFNRLGLREASSNEILRAKEAGTPGVINQWMPKLQVGPGERPVKVNAYGFDTGGTGYWVVPLEGQGH